MNEQSASGLNGASNATDFQPLTQNPQSDVGTNLQTTGAGLQSAGGNVLGTNTSITVQTSSGTVKIPPSSTPALAVQPTTPKHPPVIVWAGVGLAVILLVVMTIGIMRPRKY